MLKVPTHSKSITFLHTFAGFNKTLNQNYHHEKPSIKNLFTSCFTYSYFL
jgi:hypothetical protein